MGSYKLISRAESLATALKHQNERRTLWVVVPSLATLDYAISCGIKPSNIKLSSELQCPSCDWQTAHVGLFEDTQ